MRRYFPSLASVIAVAFLGVSVLFLLDAINPQKQEVPAPPPTNLQPGETRQDETVTREIRTDISEAAARPLFSPSRRVPEIVPIPEAPAPPPEPAPVAAPPPPIEVSAPPPPPVVMIGILEDNGRLKALVKGEKHNEQWVSIGSEIEGWRVVRITAQSITLQLNDESVDIYTVD